MVQVQYTIIKILSHLIKSVFKGRCCSVKWGGIWIWTYVKPPTLKCNELLSQCFLFPRAIAESLAIQSGNTTSPEIPSEPNNSSSSSNGVTLDDDLRLALQLSQQTLTEDEKRRQQEEEELERILKLSMQEKWPGGPKLRLSARVPPESATLKFFFMGNLQVKMCMCFSRCFVESFYALSLVRMVLVIESQERTD